MVVKSSIRDWIRSQLNITVHIMKQNPCYLWAVRKNKTRTPRGVMVHSTGCNNPRLSRYIAPDDGKLGTPSNNHWNQEDGEKKGVHAMIGKLKDNSVAVYQTLLWTQEGWHCAGKANQTHISFECLEDSIDPTKLECWQYFAQVYPQAVALTAHLCARYGLDPRKPGVVICHSEGHRLGIASNHKDVLHWWTLFGRDMDDFRRDVWGMMQGRTVPAVEIPGYLLSGKIPDYVKITASALNIRTGPGTNYSKTGKLYSGDVVKVLGQSNGWYKIDKGYISAEHTVPTNAPEQGENTEEDDDMITYEDWKKYMDRYTAEKAAEKATMPELLKDAGAMGITDMTRPMSAASRQEAAIMCRKVQLNVEDKLPGLVRAELDKLTIDPKDIGLTVTAEWNDVPKLGTCTDDTCFVPDVSNVDTGYDPDADHVAECQREV